MADQNNCLVCGEPASRITVRVVCRECTGHFTHSFYDHPTQQDMINTLFEAEWPEWRKRHPDAA